MAKGKSGSFRVNALDSSAMSAMEKHGKRMDHTGARRAVRDVSALLYDPYEFGLNLTKAHAQHIAGAKINKGANKLALHAFVQFPTDLEINDANEQMMLDQAVSFVNANHGGDAVFHARLDRDEEGRHGVDVFYAPKYEKTTKRGSTTWISLTKFGKELAVKQFGSKPKEKKSSEIDPESGKVLWEKVQDANGKNIEVACDSAYYQGQALQQNWFEHLRDVVGLDWVERGTKKIGRDPDRLEPEQYALQQDQNALKKNQNQHRKRENDLDETIDNVQNGITNFSYAIALAEGGTFGDEVTATDLDHKPPQYFETLKVAAAASGNQPTLGFLAKFWSLNLGQSGAPIPLPEKIRTAFTKAFDRVELWAARVQEREQALEGREAAVRGLERREQALEGREAAVRGLERREERLEVYKSHNMKAQEAYFENGFDSLSRAVRETLTETGFKKVENAYHEITKLKQKPKPKPKPNTSSDWDGPSR